MTGAQQVFHRACRALSVVGRDAREVFKGQPRGVVRNDNGGDSDTRKILLKVGVRRAEEHQAHRLALRAELHGALDLIRVLVDEIDDQRMLRRGKQRLKLLNERGEHLIRRALDYGRNTVAALLLERFCVCVELKPALVNNGKDGVSRLLADIGLVVEHTGDGSDGIAGFFCKIFDRHSAASLREISVCTLRILTLDRTGRNTLDDIFLAAKIENNDRNDGQQDQCHGCAHVD